MNGNVTRYLAIWMLLTLVVLLGRPHPARAAAPTHRSPPVAVTFGVQALTPDVPVTPFASFVSQTLTLPEVVCSACTSSDTWTRHWVASPLTLNNDHTRTERGWYVFNSGLTGIGIGVRTAPALQQTAQGQGAQLKEDGELDVGLVRLARQTGAGLVDLPVAEFTRITTFSGQDGTVKYVQEDTFRVSADFRVPTCTSSTGSLSLQLPDVDRAWLRQSVAPGRHADSLGSPPQLVVANCSENTRNVRIRFIPGGSVADSVAGPATLLVGRGDNQQDTGVGFLMTYVADGFGRRQHGVVHWDAAHPLALNNPQPLDNGDALSEGITVSLRAFYARPDNGLPLGAGRITAKGMYQVSYD